MLGNGLESAKVSIAFVNMYRNVQLNDYSLEGYGFNHIVRHPFNYEDENSEKEIPDIVK
jgi:hypothetical protein